MILLDTHAVVWWTTSPEHLGPAAADAIARESREGKLLLSSFSVWEAALLVEKGRLSFVGGFDTWLTRLGALPFVQFIPVDNGIAVRSVRLPSLMHADPADRIIAATALELGAPLITKDDRLRACPWLQTIW